jgi:hypothetical protein
MKENDFVEELLRSSSLGSAGARTLRTKAPNEAVRRIVSQATGEPRGWPRAGAFLNDATNGESATPSVMRDYLPRIQLVSFLETICQALELTPTQFVDAEAKYLAVADWISASGDPLLAGLHIYPQGSAALGTSIRPLTHAEFDIDLVAHLPRVGLGTPPKLVKRALGARLGEHSVYSRMLEEKPRCWRLNYAGEFHMDLTPSICNPDCVHGGELVPDKPADCWKASNPRGYRKWFEDIAALSPRYLSPVELSEAVRAQIDAIPAQVAFKGLLRRTTQLLKRHRDEFFLGRNEDTAPISIVLTTLAAQSYARCVTSGTFETEFDLLKTLIRDLPAGIEVTRHGERLQFALNNPTTSGENFCEKWNARPELADAFFRWHRAAVEDFAAMIARRGLDGVRHELVRAFGETPVDRALGGFRTSVQQARREGSLAVGTAGILSAPAPGAVPTPRNTHFGAP